jgi:hypothetical protein
MLRPILTAGRRLGFSAGQTAAAFGEDPEDVAAAASRLLLPEEEADIPDALFPALGICVYCGRPADMADRPFLLTQENRDREASERCACPKAARARHVTETFGGQAADR